MRLSALYRVLLVCFIGCGVVVVFQCSALANCDKKCRLINVFAWDTGGPTYNCYNYKFQDCRTCLGLEDGGGCKDDTYPGGGSLCRWDKSMPQQIAEATNCSLICPLPKKGKTHASGTAGVNFVEISAGTFGCYVKLEGGGYYKL